jgi:hypothetical protein
MIRLSDKLAKIIIISQALSTLRQGGNNTQVPLPSSAEIISILLENNNVRQAAASTYFLPRLNILNPRDN